MADGTLPFLIDVPICAFRPYASREYQDTFPVPSPSSVYGMLLSFVGEPSSPDADMNERHRAKEKHRGVELAIAVEALPEQSKVFRKLRRGSNLGDTRPDYQDLLMGLRIWVWIRCGSDPAEPSLAERFPRAFEQPSTIQRFGGLSLGESSYLVNSISRHESPPGNLRFIVPDPAGFFSFPVWVDHTDSKRSIRWRFRISEPTTATESLERSWLKVGYPQRPAGTAP